jgi:hypothetical protein
MLEVRTIENNVLVKKTGLAVMVLLYASQRSFFESGPKVLFDFCPYCFVPHFQ